MQQDTEAVKAAMISHHSAQDYRPQDHYGNVVSANDEYLGPYIPYVGKLYCTTKPRVLIYAMAQNLARSSGSVTRWRDRSDGGMLRQYYYPEKQGASIQPYDDGHLKVIAALALSACPSTNHRPTDNVHDRLAVTNFVKFSFYATNVRGSYVDVNPPLDIYATMWRCYTKHEIELLQPDIVIGVGHDVCAALRQGLRGDRSRAVLVEIPFPGRLNLNSRWVPRGKRLIEKGHDPEFDRATLRALLRGTHDRDRLIHRAIEIDWYFTSPK